MSWSGQTVEVEPYQMLRQMRRTVEEIKKDSPCIGVCTLNENDICIGCDRHIGDIIDNYRAPAEDTVNYTISVTPCIDICIVGDDDRCVTCGRTVVEMAIVSDAEKI